MNDLPLRIVMIAEDFSRRSGGVPAVLFQLSEKLSALGFNVHIICSHIEPMLPPDGVVLHHIPPEGLARKWYWSPKIRCALEKMAVESRIIRTIFHIHGVWQGPQYWAAKIARKYSVPYVVSAHGMLEPWLWNNQGLLVWLKKKIYWYCFAKSIYSNANKIHVITPLEQKNITSLIPDASFEIIPNAINIPSDNFAFPSFESASSPDGADRYLVFFGRIDPKKGVDILIDAFSECSIDGWRLLIVGPTWSDRYVDMLKKRAREGKAAGRIEFLGSVFDERKEFLLRNSWAMVAPSHSEVVGLVNLEAAAQCLPSITTYETGLSDWERGGGILIHPLKKDLVLALKKVFFWSAEERERRGRKSRKLVAERYNWSVVQISWGDFYKKVLLDFKR